MGLHGHGASWTRSRGAAFRPPEPAQTLCALPPHLFSFKDTATALSGTAAQGHLFCMRGTGEPLLLPLPGSGRPGLPRGQCHLWTRAAWPAFLLSVPRGDLCSGRDLWSPQEQTPAPGIRKLPAEGLVRGGQETLLSPGWHWLSGSSGTVCAPPWASRSLMWALTVLKAGPGRCRGWGLMRAEGSAWAVPGAVPGVGPGAVPRAGLGGTEGGAWAGPGRC